MTTPDELQRAVERLTALATDLDYAAMPTKPHVVTLCGSYAADARDDLRLLLSERAELLATVERMRVALEAAKALVDRDAEYIGPKVVIRFASHQAATKAVYNLRDALDRAALTTGEANHKDKP